MQKQSKNINSQLLACFSFFSELFISKYQGTILGCFSSSKRAFFLFFFFWIVYFYFVITSLIWVMLFLVLAYLPSLRSTTSVNRRLEYSKLDFSWRFFIKCRILHSMPNTSTLWFSSRLWRNSDSENVLINFQGCQCHSGYLSIMSNHYKDGHYFFFSTVEKSG
jgi:hypothetical protein